MSLAMKLRSMRAGVARTYFIDPTKKMQDVYEVVSKTHDALIAGLAADGSQRYAVCDHGNSRIVFFTLPGGSRR
jgi:hypothetical protein